MISTSYPEGVNINFLPQRSKKNPWFVRVRITQGKYEQNAFSSEADALAWAQNISSPKKKDTIKRGNRVIKETPKAVGLRMHEALQIWWEDYQNKYESRMTKESVKEVLTKYILPFFGNYFIREVTVADVVTFIKQQKSHLTYKGTPPTNKTIKNQLSPLSVFFEEQITKEIIDKNPVTIARKQFFGNYSNEEKAVANKKTKAKFLTKDEAIALLNTAITYGDSNKKTSPWLKGEIYYPLAFVLHTGCRLGEVGGASWGDILTHNLLGEELIEPRIRFHQKVIRLKDSSGQYIIEDFLKGKEEREVPINKTLSELLNYWKILAKEQGYSLSQNAPIFPLARSYTAFKNMARRVATKAGLPITKRGIHSERHAFSTFLLLQGVTIPTIGKLLGHKSPLVTMRYADILAMDIDRATVALHNILPLNTTPSTQPPLDNVSKPNEAINFEDDTIDTSNVVSFDFRAKRA